MIIGFSGAQGAGKTTLLNALPYHVDHYKVSRAVQAEFAEKYKTQNLNEVIGSNFDLMVEFQTRVFTAKFTRDYNLPKRHLILTERTFADLYAYSAQWAKKFYEKGDITQHDMVEFQTQMLDRCLDAQNEIYNHVFLLPLMNHIPQEADKQRADRESADLIYESIDLFSHMAENKIPASEITQSSIEGRVEFVKQELWNLYNV